jgi:Zn-dependent protease/CBS domain-containing protein
VFGRRIHLFTILGFSIGIDPSWFIIVVLVTWSLAEGAFVPEGRLTEWVDLAGLSAFARWIMGAVTATALFASIVAHELAHSLVARRFGVQMRGITLFIFGGVAEMADEPPSPKAELQIAIAGPVASMIIGLGLLGLGIIPISPAVQAVLLYTAWLNLTLVAFNVLPAFPLDGGRVLRSLLWAWKGNLTWATRLTSRIGSWFGAGLISLGVVLAVTINLVAGVWPFLLGLFLRNAAVMSYRQLLARHALEGVRLRRFVQREPVTVAPEITLQELVDDNVYRHGFTMFPVVSGGELLGSVSVRQVKGVPRDRWRSTTVGEVAVPCSAGNTMSADADALAALASLGRTPGGGLMVVEDRLLLGVVTMTDLLRYVSLKSELEG